MRPITIAERLRPFSHSPGACCLLPGTWWAVQAFPTLLRFTYKEQLLECGLQITGPVEQFTLQQDLERRVVWVFGVAREGYFRLRLQATPEGLILCSEKTPPGGLVTTLGKLLAKEVLLIPLQWTFYAPSHIERLSLGSHKAQDWDKVSRRMDLKEMIPFLLHLAQHIPPASLSKPLFAEEKMDALAQIASFFQMHSQKMLIPRLVDDQYHGFQSVFLSPDEEPSAIFTEAAQWIRFLFVRVEDRLVHLLPQLPSALECGRLLHIAVGSMGFLDLEWSKSLPRRAVFRALESGELSLWLPKNLQSFRIRTNRLEKGYYQKTKQPFMVKAGTEYFLDHFQLHT